MNPATALDKYTSAMNAMTNQQEANSPVFNEHKRLMLQVIDAENELRDAVAESNAGISNGAFRVTVTPQSQTWADIEAVDRLIASGSIPASLRESIVKTTQRPARISIQPQKQD